MALKPEFIEPLRLAAARTLPPAPRIAHLWLALGLAAHGFSVSPEDLDDVTRTLHTMISEAMIRHPDVRWTEPHVAELAALAFCWGQQAARAGSLLPSPREAGP